MIPFERNFFPLRDHAKQEHSHKQKSYKVVERSQNLRSTVGNTFDFYKVGLSNAEEAVVCINILGVPPFDQC